MTGQDPEETRVGVLPPGTDEDRPGRKRRVPQQIRSKDRVERILDAAAALVVQDGVEGLSTRAIAERARVPVASLYQYFADKDAIMLALVERDIDEMDARVRGALARLEVLSVHGIVGTTMGAYVSVYLERPAFVMIWLRGRANQAIRAHGRRHNRQVAADLFALARDAGLLTNEADPLHAELAVEMGDRLFQLAFEEEVRGDRRVLDEAVTVVATYLERYASAAGLQGVPRHG